MKYTNIYLGFEKIKNNIKGNTHFCGIKELGFSHDEKEMNQRISSFLQKVFKIGGNRRKVSDLPTAKQYGFSEHLLLVDYLEYTFLYVLYDNMCIWVNYAEKGKKMCEKGVQCLWDYLPCLKDTVLYRCVRGEKYYIVNTYEAFTEYAGKCKLSQYPTREHNLPFYADVEMTLQINFPDHFCYKEENQLHCQKRVEEGEYTMGMQRENYALCFTFLFIDNMIIVCGCDCIFTPKLITGNI